MAMPSMFRVCREQAQVVVRAVIRMGGIETLEPIVDDVPVRPKYFVEEGVKPLLVLRRELGDARRHPERCGLPPWVIQTHPVGMAASTKNCQRPVS